MPSSAIKDGNKIKKKNKTVIYGIFHVALHSLPSRKPSNQCNAIYLEKPKAPQAVSKEEGRLRASRPGLVAHHQTHPFPGIPTHAYKLKLQVESAFFFFLIPRYKPLLKQPKPQGGVREGKTDIVTTQFKISKPHHHCEKPRPYQKLVVSPQCSQALVYRITSRRGGDQKPPPRARKATSLIYRIGQAHCARCQNKVHKAYSHYTPH